MSDNISVIIAIVTSVGLISSEILPFIPTECNGIVHSIFFYLSKLNTKKKEESSKKEESPKKEESCKKEESIDNKELLKKIDQIISVVNKNETNHLLMKEIKSKVDSIYLQTCV